MSVYLCTYHYGYRLGVGTKSAFFSDQPQHPFFPNGGSGMPCSWLGPRWDGGETPSTSASLPARTPWQDLLTIPHLFLKISPVEIPVSRTVKCRLCKVVGQVFVYGSLRMHVLKLPSNCQRQLFMSPDHIQKTNASFEDHCLLARPATRPVYRPVRAGTCTYMLEAADATRLPARTLCLQTACRIQIEASSNA